MTMQCPRCGSAGRATHGSVLIDGEMQPCDSAWHYESTQPVGAVAPAARAMVTADAPARSSDALLSNTIAGLSKLISDALASFKSGIKCGDAWSPTRELEHTLAINALADLVSLARANNRSTE